MPKRTEPIDSLRTVATLLSAEGGKRARMVLLASPTPRQGTSSVAVSLGLVLSAELGFRTLLIDAHTARPTLHKMFGVDKSPGLVEEAGGLVGVGSAARETRHPRLFLLPAGDGGAGAVGRLFGTVTPDYLRILGEKYEQVIADGPPVLTSSESLAVASCFDGVILVVATGAARVDDVRKARGLLERAGVPVLGAILNRVPA